MPMRFGEMVLVIRTQDYASRNLSRLSQNLGKLSKTQQLQRRLQMQGLQADRLVQRQNTLGRDIGMLRQRLALEQNLFDVQARRRQEARRLGNLERAADPATGQIRGAAGRFVGSAAPALAAASSEVARLQAAEKALLKEHGALLDSMRLTKPALATMNSTKAAAELGRLEKHLDFTSRRLRIVQSDIAVTQKAINQLRWDNIHRGGQAFARAGRIMQLTGLVATGSLVVAGNAAADFGQNVTLAATQARDLNAPLEQVAIRSTKLQNAILDQMQKFPGSADSMSNAAYEIFSSLDLADKGRIKFWRGLQLLEKANQVAVAGGIELDDAIKGLIITLNNFDPDLNNVNETLDTMFDIVRFGNIRVSDFTQLITRVAATAKGLGHTLDDLAAPIAMLTRVLPSERVGTGLFRLEEVFGNRDFQEGFKLISQERIGKGLEFRKAGGGLIPFQQILEDIVKVFPELEDGTMDVAEFLKIVSAAGKTARTGKPSEGQLFTSQARNVLRPLVQDMDQLREIQGLIAGNEGEFNRAFAAMAKTPAVQWKIFLNQLKAVSLEIGRDALPALLYLAGGIKQLINWFRNLDPRTKSLAIRIAVFASVAALVGGILLSVVGGIISLVGAVALLTGGLGGAGGAVAQLTSVYGILKLLGTIGIITIGVNVVLNWLGMDQQGKQDLATGFLENMKSFFGDPRHPTTIPFAVPRGIWKNINTFFDALDASKARKNFKDAEGIIDTNLKRFEKKKSKKSIEDILFGAKKDYLAGVRRDLKMSLEEIRKQFGATGEDAQGMAEQINSAAEQAAQSIDQAASNMTQIWEQFRQENTAAFGELFSGPFFQSETWSLAEEWDVKPTMREINRDLKEQIQAFRKWRSTLASISKRKGATPELMKELQALGPGAMKFLDVLRKGSPGAWNQFIGLWRTKQNEITKATQIDFNKQLKQWFKYGSNIAKQIILGLRSENVALDNAFKKYIINKFPGIVADAEKQAIKEWRQTHPKAAGTSGGGSQTGTGGKNNSDNTNVTVIVHPREGETTEHALKRGAWEYANGGGSKTKKKKSGSTLTPRLGD